MQKILLLGIYLALSLAMQAQITLGTQHIPQMGDKLYIGIDSTEFWYDNPDYGLSTGEDKDWTFDLIQIETTQVHNYKDAMEGAVPSDFPDADMIGPFFGGEGYYKHEADGLSLLGYYGSPIDLVDLDLSVVFAPSYTVLPAEMTYGDTITDTYAFYEELLNANIPISYSGFDLVISSAKLEVTSTVEYVADGWGTFTTPYGTWEVLRIVKTEHRNTQGMAELPIFGWQDLAGLGLDGFGEETLTTIMFINNMVKEPIIEFEIDNDGPNAANRPARAIRFKIPDSEIVAIESPVENENIDMIAYPNPAVNDVNLSLTGFASGYYNVNIFNIMGGLVAQHPVEINGDMSVCLDVSQLSRGTYLYNVNDAFGQILMTKRLVVLKP